MKRFLQAVCVCAALSFAVIGCEKKEEPKVEPTPTVEPAPAPTPAPAPVIDSTIIKDSIAKAEAAKKEAEEKAKKGGKKAKAEEVKSSKDASTGVNTVQKRAGREDEKPKVEEKPAQDPNTIKTVQKRKSRDD